MSLAERQRDAGAVQAEGLDTVLHYGDPGGELEAGLRSAALVDRSGRGRIHLTGSRRLEYLHRVTAQSVRDLAPPSGVRAALLERTGKIVDVLSLHAFSDHVLALTSAANRDRARDWLTRFIFREDVQIQDRADASGQLLLMGPRAGEVAASLAGPESADLDLHAWCTLTHPLDGHLVRAASSRWILLGATRELPALWDTALDRGREAGLRPAGEEAWQALRVLAGLPGGGREIGGRSNPLELGLEDSVDLGKGCFTGQEALAKMMTHGSVKRRLVGLELACGGREGEELLAGGETVGRITSAAPVPGSDRRVALALVRRDQIEPDTRLRCAENGGEAIVRSLPFPR